MKHRPHLGGGTGYLVLRRHGRGPWRPLFTRLPVMLIFFAVFSLSLAVFGLFT